jgi:hypothetical protein
MFHNQRREWRASENLQRIDGFVDRVPEFNPRSADHLWTYLTMYRTDPTNELPMLDRENLLSIVGPCCFYCERGYSPLLASRRCKGKPYQE